MSAYPAPMPSLARLYTLAVLGCLLLYFLSGPFVFSSFWGGPGFPVPILGLLTVLLPLLLVGRLLLAWQGSMPLTAWGLAGNGLLLLTTLQGVIGAGSVGETGPLLLLRTVTSAWMLWLGGEVLAQASRRAWWVVVGGGLAGCAAAVFAGVRIGILQTGEASMRFYTYDSVTGIPRQADYFAITDPLALLGVLLLARLRTRPVWALAAFTVTAGLLFVGFSRTSLALYLSGAALVVLQARAGVVIRAVMLAGLLGAGLAVTNLTPERLEVLNASVQRMGILVTDLDQDGSYLARQELQQRAERDVSKYWLTGRYGAEVIEHGVGEYAHNWLSYLISFGIVPFTVSLLLMLGGVWRAWRAGDVGALALIVAGIGSVLLSRAYIWPYIWFAVSLALHSRPLFAPAPSPQPESLWELLDDPVRADALR